MTSTAKEVKYFLRLHSAHQANARTRKHKLACLRSGQASNRKGQDQEKEKERRVQLYVKRIQKQDTRCKSGKYKARRTELFAQII